MIKDIKTSNCWEILRCKEVNCPVYKVENLICWLVQGTHCYKNIQGNSLDKLELCADCKVLISNLNPKTIRHTFLSMGKQFKEYKSTLKEREKEIENLSLELSISISEIFEALRKISSGDPYVKIDESSNIELVHQLKKVINQTAKEIKEIIDLSHEFAIALAEQFDVLHNVSKGDLTAKIEGSSKIEILESLKKVTNETIENISKEINKRKIAEEALRKSEERYKIIFESAGTPTLIIDNNFYIRMANKEFEKFSGYKRSEVENKSSLINFISKTDQEKLKNLDIENVSQEFRFLDKNKKIKDVSIVLSDIPESNLKIATILELTKLKQREMEAIITLTTALRSAIKYKDMLPIITDQLINLLKPDGIILALKNIKTGDMFVETAYGNWKNLIGNRLDYEKETKNLLNTSKNYILWNLKDKQNALDFHNKDLINNIQFLILLPLIANNNIIGIMYIGRNIPFAEYEIRLLTAIVDIIANAINRANLNEQTEERLHRLSALHAIDMAISATLDLNVTLDVLLTHVINELKVDAATILLIDPISFTLEHAASRGFHSNAIKNTKLKLGQGHAGKSALERRIVSIPNVLESDDPCVRAQILSGELFMAHHAVPLISKGQLRGVLEVFHRSPLEPDSEWLEFFQALATQAAIAIDNSTLLNELQRSNIEIGLAYDATLEGWTKALDMRDKETEGHTLRVTELTIKLAKIMGINESELIHIRRGALLHDIGKMSIPDSILLKSGPLTEQEREIMKKHPLYAYEMLLQIPFLRPALNIPYCHHEKWDGTGYPRGLKGTEIPLEARIFAVVDVWDAMKSDRTYRKAHNDEEIINYIKEQSGKHFDPEVVEVFLRMVKHETFKI